MTLEDEKERGEGRVSERRQWFEEVRRQQPAEEAEERSDGEALQLYE